MKTAHSISPTPEPTSPAHTSGSVGRKSISANGGQKRGTGTRANVPANAPLPKIKPAPEAYPDIAH